MTGTGRLLSRSINTVVISAVKASGEKLGMWDRASLIATLLNGTAGGDVPSRDDVMEAIKNAEALQ